MGGSNGLKKYIKDNNFCKIKNLIDITDIKLAIDVSGVIHRAKIHSGNDKWFLQIINLIHKFSKYLIKPIFIFDGRPSIEKQNTIDQRKNRQDIHLGADAAKRGVAQFGCGHLVAAAVLARGRAPF